MVTNIFASPAEMAGFIAAAAKEKRLSLNMSQKSLSDRSGVSFGVLKKFERTGKISLESLLKLALALGSLSHFNELFRRAPPAELRSLDEILKDKSRKRGRK